MAWKYGERTLKVGKGWTDSNGYKHPYNWCNSWTDQNKTDWGVTFEADADTSFDNRFYFAKDLSLIHI